MKDSPPMRLRLYHHHDGARVAYREVGAGPPLALLHAGLLSHREWEPVVARLAERHRVVVPDLPLHGDSEDRPRHPYTIDWFAEVMGGFCEDVLGPVPLLVGHDAGAEILLRAIATDLVAPSRLVLMPSRLHLPPQRARKRQAWRLVTLGGSIPGLDRALSHATKLVFTPRLGVRLSERGSPEAGDLMRHAFADVPGNPNLARSWSKCARRWPRGTQTQLLDLYPRLGMPVLLLWADRDPLHPLAGAEETMTLLPRAQLRVLPSTGYLMTYDDPVGVAREILAFCR
ncbi:MAG TPA: alpha/beta hydrolase [Solirubrobacteraceae bacterium]|nr:alpha/beta hydrolase [Solirubrobacteraceae bacterium]